VGNQQNQVEVDNTDDLMDKEATEAQLAIQLEIDKHCFQLRGIRNQQPVIIESIHSWCRQTNRSQGSRRIDICASFSLTQESDVLGCSPPYDSVLGCLFLASRESLWWLHICIYFLLFYSGN